MLNMKINKSILLSSVALIFIFSACKKVELTPNGVTPPSTAFTTEADVKDALNAAYSMMTSGGFYGGRLQVVSEYLADMADGSKLTGYEADIYNFKSNPNSGTASIYADPYVVIQRANTTLENLDLVTSSPATKNNYEGQAKFLRAAGHFELVRLFAQPFGFSADNTHLGVVIKTKSAFEADRSRNTVAEVYAQVLSDLRDAQNLLPDENGVYASKWAAKGYLARVFFQMNKFDSAYFYANEVIASNKFPFDNSAAYITKRFNNPVTTEAIFYLVNEVGQTIRYGTLRNDANTDLSLGLPITAATYSAGTSDPNDVRKAWYVNTSGVLGINKYKDNDFILPLLHITELKLIRAESAGQLNQNLPVAIQDLNDILARAYGGTKSISASATAALVISTAREQRKLEMIYESGDRLQQIKRIGAKGETSFAGPAQWNCPGLVLQFPASEFNVNSNFTPNPNGGCTR